MCPERNSLKRFLFCSVDARKITRNAEKMSVLRKFLFGLILIALNTAPGAAQEPMERIFAECAGRFSAEREHAWLMKPDDASYFEARRSTFLSLLEATLTGQRNRTTLTHRIEAKIAHAGLLTQATFGSDKNRAASAKRLAARHIDQCQSLLLGG